MKKLLIFVLFISIGCQKQTIRQIEVITESVRIDSLLTILDSLQTVRSQQADPNSNASKKIYAEEIFKYRMIDTLAVIYPAIQNKPDSSKLAKLDSVIAKFAHADSTDDRGIKSRSRILKWLSLSLAERKNRLKKARFIGKLIYASRNHRIAIFEQFKWAMFDDKSLRRVIKKLAIGRLHEGQGTIYVGYIFNTTTAFDNKLVQLRSKYFESIVK